MSFTPKYAKFYGQDLSDPCEWEQLTKEELARMCDMAAGYFMDQQKVLEKQRGEAKFYKVLTAVMFIVFWLATFYNAGVLF